MGAGFLLEAGGDDAYDGLYYVQGASAHTAIGVFLDDGGDDTYDAVMRTVATSIGVGHDLSLGLHRDTGGDDAYRAPLLSLGTGSANGVGVFVADGGDDTFTAVADPTLGAATPSDLAGTERASEPTIGVFAKSAGSASYEVGGKKVKHAKSTWTSGGTPGTGARGVGVDKT